MVSYEGLENALKAKGIGKTERSIMQRIMLR